MGKQTFGQKSKLMIARDKFCDADFDKLVVDTSHSVTRRTSLDDVLGPLDQRPTGESSPASSLVGASCDQVATSTTITAGHQDRLNQPKRPMNAFMVWGQAIRRELHHKFSNVQNALLSKALGRVWRSLEPADKEPFVRRANTIKANHKRDYPNYRYQPRRVQERRAKNNMLIGINLNHPVNQYQCQQATYSSSLEQTAIIAGTNNYNTQSQQFATHSSSGYHGGQSVVSEDSNRKLLMSSNWRRNLTIEPRARNPSKETVNDAQTFEYHPYPPAAAGSDTIPITTTECNNCRLATTTSVGCQNLEANCREGQYQTSIYPPYQQVSYNTQQQQIHQHHHQQPQHHYNDNQQLPQQQHQAFSYDVTQLQSIHMESRYGGSLKTLNNTTGFYYAGK